MLDRTKRETFKADEREVELANEENEWVRRLEGLAAIRKKEKKPTPPRKFKRQSARQRNAIGRL